MKRLKIIFLYLLLISCSETGMQKISILETTDIHGVIFPYDFIEKKDIDVSMAGMATYINQLRSEEKEIILLDNGDNLQGQPVVYYYNFIDTLSPHINSEVMNYLGYDAGTVGNHDIEAGHDVYDRLVKEYDFPLLAANAVDIKTGKPYFKPYVIIEKKHLKVAVMGLVTPAIPTWLPPELYSGMEFRDMLETAKLWMPVILKENPDLIIGLFHSGWNRSEMNNSANRPMDENGSASVAYEVPGFDIIFNGHDHNVINQKIVNIAGDTVLILDGGSRSEKIARADVVFLTKGGKKKIISGEIIDVKDYEPDSAFLAMFASTQKTVLDYVDKVIATSASTITSRDSYFGSSSFVDMIHAIQLEITGADISFAAPLSFDVSINAGPVSVGDMFKLYRFENMLYTMSLTGAEVLKYLEYSYSDWYNTMKGPDDTLLKLRMGDNNQPVLTNGKAWLKNQPYNFDSAAGIDYTVDVSKPEGSRITIRSLSGGIPFDPDKKYSVAVNSYRGNGGGGHLTEGAGLSSDDLKDRLISSTERDLRFYILKSIEGKGAVDPKPLNNWHLEPAKWIKNAAARDYKLLFD